MPSVSPLPDYEPVYCLKCRSVIPEDIAETQTLCPACLDEERKRAAEFARSHQDTGISICPKCGSRDLKTTMHHSTALGWILRLAWFYFMLNFWYWFLRTDMETDRFDEGEIRLTCNECGHIF